MKIRSCPPVRDRRSFGASLTVRWMLTLLVAFDLIGSPFHAHRHDLGADGHGPHAVHAADTSVGGEPLHVEADEGAAFGHSLTMLLPAEPQPGKWRPTLHTVVYALALASSPQSLMLARAAWDASPDRVPIPPYPHLRPDGRAPPSLHI